MKKFFTFIFSFLSVFFLVIFFALLNVKISLSSTDKVKSIAAESNFYGVAATYLKNEIIKQTGLSLDQGKNFELLNSAINSDSAKPVVDKAIEDIFVAINNKDQSKVIPVIFSASDNSGLSFSFDKKINLNNNAAIIFLQNINIILYVSLFLVLVFLAVVLLVPKKIEARLSRFSFLAKVAGLLLAIFWAILYYVLPNQMMEITSRSNFFVEQKLVNAFSKLLSVVISRQTVLYLPEILILLVIGLFVGYLAGLGKKEDLGKIDVKI